ncbi:MAG: hypothetical protein ACSHXD_04175 [Marinosulfonomonas sp.]
MKTDTHETPNKSDGYFIYFAGVILALLSSSWIAQIFVAQLARVFPMAPGANLQIDIAAGLFFAISFANPFGTLIHKTPIKRSLAFMVLGFAFGYFAQHLYFTPLAGAGLSTFLHLLLVTLVLPVVAGIRHIGLLLEAEGIEPKTALAEGVLMIAQLPDRLLFIILMALSFAAFWRFTDTTAEVLMALGVVLTVLTVLIAARKWETEAPEEEFSPDFQAWLDMEPEDPEITNNDITGWALAETKKLARTILPGAILFGGMTRLAVDLLIWLYPNLHTSLENPEEKLQTLGILAASGLGLVLLGMVVSLGFSFMLLQLIGRIGNWSDTHLRENCYQLLRTLYFRPMRRN